MSSVEFSVSDVLGRAWELTKKHGVIIALFILVASMVGSGMSQIFGFSVASQPWLVDPAVQPTPEELRSLLGCYVTFVPLMLLVQLALQVGLQNMFLSALRGKNPDLSAFKLPWRTYGLFILVSIAMGMAVYVGVLCCILPGIYLAVRLAYAPMLVLDNPDCKFEEALKGSWRMTKGNFWKLFGLGICAYLITCLGLLACCVGVYFTCVIAGFAFVISYDILKAANGGGDEETVLRQPSPDVVPPVSAENSAAESKEATPEEANDTVLFPEQGSEPAVTAEFTKEEALPSTEAADADFSVEGRSASATSDGLCDVVLLSVGDRQEVVLRVIMNSVYGKGASEVRALLETVPCVLMEKVPHWQAERLKNSLEEIGARADIR